MLKRAKVLIVEDEAMIAMLLAALIEDADGCVVASCETVYEALAALDGELGLNAAILDFRLADGEVTPVAERLLDRGIPVVLHTASPVPESLLARTPHLVHCPKPANAQLLLGTLCGQLVLNPGLATTATMCAMPNLQHLHQEAPAGRGERVRGP